MEQDDPAGAEAEEGGGSRVPHPGGQRLRLRLRPPRPRKKLSQILAELAADPSRPRVSIADLVQAMHGRAFGALLLIFAVPNALPAIPGTSGILGLPLLFLAFQMMLGRQPWLPKVISLRSMSRDDFANLVERVNPWLEWADRFTAPRLQILVTPRAERVIGAFVLVLAIVLTLPIPLGNMLPGLAICMIALGVLERDGLWIGGGVVVGLIAIAVVWGVVYTLARAAWFVVAGAF